MSENLRKIFSFPTLFLRDKKTEVKELRIIIFFGFLLSLFGCDSSRFGGEFIRQKYPYCRADLSEFIRQTLKIFNQSFRNG